MKKLLMVVLLCGSLVAQEKIYQIPESQLTEQQKQKLEGVTPKSVHDWVGMGDEIGKAVNSSLAAITTQSNNFAQTPVGKLTAAIVVFKLVGDAAIHLAAGVGIFLSIFPLWIWSYTRYIPRRVVIEITKNADKSVTKKYDIINKLNDDEANAWRMGHWGALLALFIVCAFTIFSY